MYDYVIVGAGSAGCILAHRLTEDPDTRVLLLEAGGPDSRPEIHIPATFSRLFKTDADWAYHTVPQRHAADREWFWPRGKVLGGSSSINAMIYIRGH
ncbi:MAG TPA: choline dehydrogenase, partial [Rhodothermales bacterium]|nr:choline dehydrogenase [Rhodothermales bacterium]